MLTMSDAVVQPLDIIKSPMILLALFSMAMVFGMPYLMENSKSLLHIQIHMEDMG